jgi:hypothetical protein
MQNSYMKKGGKWIQKATASIKRRGTEGVCTGAKFGGPTCPKGSKRYNLAKTFKGMAKRRGKDGLSMYTKPTGNKGMLKQAYMKTNY